MVAVGNNYRSQTELRKRPRRPFHYRARILTSKKGQPRPCSVEDISESGARIVLQKDEDLPKRFLLLLTSRGVARVCRQVWRNDLTVGVEFLESDGL
jgi:hypothetical protein